MSITIKFHLCIVERVACSLAIVSCTCNLFVFSTKCNTEPLHSHTMPLSHRIPSYRSFPRCVNSLFATASFDKFLRPTSGFAPYICERTLLAKSWACSTELEDFGRRYENTKSETFKIVYYQRQALYGTVVNHIKNSLNFGKRLNCFEYEDMKMESNNVISFGLRDAFSSSLL